MVAFNPDEIIESTFLEPLAKPEIIKLNNQHNKKNSPLAQSVNDVLYEIALQLDAKSICQLSLSSALFLFLNNKDELWKQKILEKFSINNKSLIELKAKYGSYNKTLRALSNSHNLYQCPSYWMFVIPNSVLEIKIGEKINIIKGLNSEALKDFLIQDAKTILETAKYNAEHQQKIISPNPDLRIFPEFDQCLKEANHPTFASFRDHTVIFFGLDVEKAQIVQFINDGSKKEAIFPHFKLVCVPNQANMALTYQNGKLEASKLEMIDRDKMPDRLSVCELENRSALKI